MGLGVSFLSRGATSCAGTVKTAVADIDYNDLDVAEVIYVPKKGTMQLSSEAVEWSDIGNTDVVDLVKRHIQSKQPSQSFLVVDVTKTKRLYDNWTRLLPRVEPFYAVTCNSDAMVIRTLAKMGANFDCISEREVKMVMNEGVASSKIILASPCKHPTEIAAVHKNGVRLMTFDTVNELEKLSKHAPDVQAVMRIRANDGMAEVSTPVEFGAEMDEWDGLYAKAKELGVDIVGISFHLGCSAMDTSIFSKAISRARKAFDIGQKHGFNLSVLDIGGGFESGDIDGDMSQFENTAMALRESLDCHFPLSSGIRIIAEPGRYFTETCVILATIVIGVRDRISDGVARRDYWITDGIHGCFNPVAMRRLRFHLVPITLRDTPAGRLSFGSVFGPTSERADIVIENALLPRVSPDDWLLFHNMGAYTSNVSCCHVMHKQEDIVYIT